MSIYKVEPTKDGRSWIFMTYKKDYVGNNKRYKSKRFKTKSEAKEAENLFLMKRDNPIKKPFQLIAKEYFDHIKETKRKSTVISYEQAYNKNIKGYFNKKIDVIDLKDIKYWKEEMIKKNFSYNYLKKLYQIINDIYHYAMKTYGITYNPVEVSGRFEKVDDSVLEDKNKLKYISYEDFNNFVSVIDDIKWKTFFIVLYYTGMRKGEVQALKISDIDFFNNEIIVNKTLSLDNGGFKTTKTKNGKNRKIKMSKILREQLEIYISTLKKYNNFSEDWFLFGCVYYLPRATIDRHKKYYFNLYNSTHENKINEITIHEFRHSHISLLVNQYIQSSKEKNMKVDATKFFLMMSDRMGHTVSVMQKTYMHLFDNVQDEIVDLLDNL